jgi:hypothetical protein
MRNTDQLAVEVHFFAISAEELAERSSRLRALLLRGALRSTRESVDRESGDGNAEFTAGLPLDLVKK